jgi:hypothetical protein
MFIKVKCFYTVDIERLPPALATRHAFVHAKMLQSCGQFDNALERAQEASKGVAVSFQNILWVGVGDGEVGQ